MRKLSDDIYAEYSIIELFFPNAGYSKPLIKI